MPFIQGLGASAHAANSGPHVTQGTTVIRKYSIRRPNCIIGLACRVTCVDNPTDESEQAIWAVGANRAVGEYAVLGSFSVGELGESDLHSVAYNQFWCLESVNQRK
jgi:hypothetical protein